MTNSPDQIKQNLIRNAIERIEAKFGKEFSFFVHPGQRFRASAATSRYSDRGLLIGIEALRDNQWFDTGWAYLEVEIFTDACKL